MHPQPTSATNPSINNPPIIHPSMIHGNKKLRKKAERDQWLARPVVAAPCPCPCPCLVHAQFNERPGGTVQLLLIYSWAPHRYVCQ
jgi:hypothetical protein